MPTKSKSTGTAAGDKPVKSAFKPITGKKAAVPAAPAEAEEKKSAKSKRGPKAGEEPVVEKPKEALSLIDGDDKPKTPRVRKASSLTNPVLPSISKFNDAATAAAAAPAVPEVIVAPAAEAPAEELVAEVSPTGEKLIHLKPPFTVKDLAAALNLKPFVLIKNLMDIGVFANQNQNLETDVASKICEIHGFKFEKERRKEGGGVHKLETKVVAPPAPKPEEVAEDDEPDVLKVRPPVVTFMGHVEDRKSVV